MNCPKVKYRIVHPRICALLFFTFTVFPVVVVWILYGFVYTVPSCPGVFLDATNSVHALILEAGKADDDKLRYDALVRLRDTGKDIEGLDDLLEIAHRYGFPESPSYVEEMRLKSLEKLSETGYLAGWFWDKVWPTKISMFVMGSVYPTKVDTDSLVYPVWCYYRGRMLAHAVLENNILEKLMYAEAQEYLECSAKHFGEEGILGMYLGQAIEWPDVGTLGAGDAPLWAQEQAKATAKLLEVLQYWVRERQIENGEFGGGTNDDVEIWRQFKSLIIGFEDSETVEAIKLLGDYVLGMDRMSGGFVDELHDVEHSAEESSDSMLPVMLLDIERAVPQLLNTEKISSLFLNSWTGPNERNGTMFKSSFFSSIEVSDDKRMMCDVALNIRAVQPTLLAWQYGREGATALEFADRMKDWMKNWINAASTSECGKPKFIIPSTLRYPSSVPGGPITKGWMEPGCKYVCLELERFGKVCEHHRDAFSWPSSIKGLSETMALVAFKQKWCGGLRSLVDAVALNEEVKEENEDWDGRSELGREGSGDWAKSKNLGVVVDGIIKWKFLTDGGTDFDDVIESDLVASKNVYTQFLLKSNYDLGVGSWDEVKTSMEGLGKGFSHNKASLTSEVRFTDRLMKFYKYGRKQGFKNSDYPAVSGASEDIYRVVTGDINAPSYATVQAVSWVSEGGRELAVVVTKNKVTSFEAVVYSFRAIDRVLGMRLKRLLGLGTTYVYKLVEIVEGEEGDVGVCGTNVEVAGSGGEFTVEGGTEGEGGTGDWPLVNVTIPGEKLVKICIEIKSGGGGGNGGTPFGQNGGMCRAWVESNPLEVETGDQGECQITIRPILPLVGVTKQELIAIVVAIFVGFVGSLLLCFCRIARKVPVEPEEKDNWKESGTMEKRINSDVL